MDNIKWLVFIRLGQLRSSVICTGKVREEEDEEENEGS